jgi:TolB protein
MGADGKNARQMTVEPATFVGWLPGGDRLATLNKNRDDRRLWAVELESGRRTPLSERPIETGLGRLSPDGKTLALNSRQSGTINVWTVAIGGGEPKQLTFDREMMGFPCWSPDGKWIAIEVKRGANTHLAVIPSDGQTGGGESDIEQLTSEPGQSWPGSWAPDGDHIAFAGQRQGIWNIYWVARGDHRVKRVTGYQKPNTYVRYPAWSPRGDQIIYEYAETRGNIWMMTFK